MTKDIWFAPSLMCMDIGDTRRQIEVFERYCHILHADIMDGHFAKNITLGPDLIHQIKAMTSLPIEAHLMVEHPEEFIDIIADAGADYISLHAETIRNNSFSTIRRIQSIGCKVGVVVCPATPLIDIDAYLDQIDLLTIMTVEVGYAGQRFIPQMLRKIEHARDLREKNGYKYMIQVDGAVGPNTYKEMYEAGARAFVMGSSGLFKPDVENIETACIQMREEFLAEILKTKEVI